MVRGSGALLLGLLLSINFAQGVSANHTADQIEFEPVGRVVVDATAGRDFALDSVRVGGVLRRSGVSITTEIEAANRTELLNLYITVPFNAGTFRIGQGKVRTGLSISSSSRFTSFANRPTIVNLIGGVDRLLGVETSLDFGAIGIQSGVYRGALADNDDNSEFVAATRLLWRNVHNEKNHISQVGFSLRNRQARNTIPIQGVVNEPALFATQAVALPDVSEDNVFVLEAYFQRDRLAVASELISYQSSVQDALGSYFEVGWMISGQRQFDAKSGVFRRPKVSQHSKNSFLHALEIAARTEWLSLNGRYLNGQQFSQSLGLVWHLSEGARVLSDASIVNRSGDLAGATDVLVNARLQFFF